MEPKHWVFLQMLFEYFRENGEKFESGAHFSRMREHIIRLLQQINIIIGFSIFDEFLQT